MDKNKAIEPILDIFRRTNRNNSATGRKKERTLTPEAVEKSKKLEDIKNAKTYPGELDPLEVPQ